MPCFLPFCRIIKSRQMLWEHIVIQHKSLFINCQYKCIRFDCTKSYEKIEQLIQHQEQKHGSFLYCKRCKVVFSSKTLLKKHDEDYENVFKLIREKGTSANVEYVAATVEKASTVANTSRCDIYEAVVASAEETSAEVTRVQKRQRYVWNNAVKGNEEATSQITHKIQPSFINPWTQLYREGVLNQLGSWAISKTVSKEESNESL